METFNYMPFLALGAVLGTLTIVSTLVLSVVSARTAERNHHEMTRFMQFIQLENSQTHKMQSQTLAELKQMNKDNALYLRMILERVDEPPDQKSSG